MDGREQLLIGTHTSTSGCVHNALIRGQEIDATTIQIFTSNQKQADEDLALQKEHVKFHPGSATGAPKEECLEQIVGSLITFKPLLENKKSVS